MNKVTSLPSKQFRKVEWQQPVFFVKSLNFEYWPTWIAFFPAILYALYLAVKARSLTYFTAANPGIELGGFFGESKINILKKIDPKYLPATFFFPAGTDAFTIQQYIAQSACNYPVICKPDKGERGFHVQRIDNYEELEKYLLNYSGDIIVQEYINYEIELGILFYRMPDGSESGITSVVKKEFLEISGNGLLSIEELIDQHCRARIYKEALQRKFQSRFNQVLPNGQRLVLEQIGNHCRGTKFINGNSLINEQLLKVMNDIAKSMDGFYFGRFDLKVKTIDDLYNGKEIRIMEVNGTTSEPGHIYDPDVSFLDAQNSILYNTGLVYKIARQNHQKGIFYTSVGEVFKIVKTHFAQKKVHGY